MLMNYLKPSLMNYDDVFVKSNRNRYSIINHSHCDSDDYILTVESSEYNGW